MLHLKKADGINEKDMIFSRRELLKIMIPMFFQQVLNMTVGMINTMMVSNAGEAAVSGVSLVNSLDAVLIVFFTALVSGGSVVIAQTLGTKNTKNVSESAKQLLYAATTVAILVSFVVLVFRIPLFSVLFGDAEADVLASAHDYFFFVALSFPLLAINEATGACFRAAGNSFISLIVSFAINVMVVCGNGIFVMGLDMGARGAALSTLFARLGGAVILLILIHRKKYPVHIEKIFHYRPNLGIIKKILHIGVPNGIENTLFQFGRLMTQSLISILGTTVIAANSVALNIANFQYCVNTAFAAVMIPVVGRCIGARKIDQAKYYSRKLLFMCYAGLWLVIGVTLIFIGPLISSYSLSEEASGLTAKLVILHSIVAALIYPLGFLLPTTFRAASDVRFTLVISMVSMWGLRVASAYVLALDAVSVFNLFTIPGFGLGVIGVWIGMMLDWIFRASIYTVRYVSGRWLKVKKYID